MRVVHIFKDYYPPTTGGIEQHMRLLCTRLAETHEVVVLVPSGSRRMVDEHIDGVRVLRVPEFGRYASAPLCPTAPWVLRRMRPDLVHLHFPNPMGDLTYLLSGVTTPLVISYHADIVKQRAYLPFYRPIRSRLFARAACIIGASEEYVQSSDFLREHVSRTTVIPYGIDPESVALVPGETAAVRQMRGESPLPLVLFVGALRYYKGLDVLLKAMARVEARAVIAGRGSPNQLQTLARRIGVAHRVEFVGEVSESRLRVLFHAADVLVLPSIDRCEAFGISQLEAMACAKPVISTDLPTGVRLVNQDGVNGLRVAPGNVDALAAALSRLLGNPELRARLGAAGRRRVENEFNAARMIRQTLDVYADVLENGPVRAEPRFAVS